MRTFQTCNVTNRYRQSLGFDQALIPIHSSEMPAHQDVEFKTIDGVTLRGRAYPATEKGAAVVLCPGVSVKTLTKTILRMNRH